MDKHERRRKVREWQAEQSRQAALVKPRHYRDEFALDDFGHLVLRICVLPAFEFTEVWDVRHDIASDELRLYVARSTEPAGDQVVGYEFVAVVPDALGRTIRSLRSVSKSLEELDESASTDGVLLELVFYGSVHSSVSFRWAESSPPSGWEELDGLTSDTLRVFRSAPTMSGRGHG
jgi:hypothetical protein